MFGRTSKALYENTHTAPSPETFLNKPSNDATPKLAWKNALMQSVFDYSIKRGNLPPLQNINRHGPSRQASSVALSMHFGVRMRDLF